jgi:hypothetical protein
MLSPVVARAGALAAGQLDKADKYALDTYDLARAALRTQRGSEPRLPIALGAAIRCVRRSARRPDPEAVAFLRRELDT